MEGGSVMVEIVTVARLLWFEDGVWSCRTPVQKCQTAKKLLVTPLQPGKGGKGSDHQLKINFKK